MTRATDVARECRDDLLNEVRYLREENRRLVASAFREGKEVSDGESL